MHKGTTDFYYDLGNAIMFVEADEHMHRDRVQECEIVRMYDVTDGRYPPFSDTYMDR
jgi:hypothetical protein